MDLLFGSAQGSGKERTSPQRYPMRCLGVTSETAEILSFESYVELIVRVTGFKG